MAELRRGRAGADGCALRERDLVLVEPNVAQRPGGGSSGRERSRLRRERPVDEAGREQAAAARGDAGEGS